MSGHPDPDDELMGELRELLGLTDPVPAEVTDFARAALGWRRLDADLAELLEDSALEAGSAALTRSGGTGSRWLTFRADDASIEIEIELGAESGAHAMRGQIEPAPGAASVELQRFEGGTAAAVEADALGRFRLTLDTGGRFRLRLFRRDPPGPPVETSWFTV
jgi:hypothetical protein